MPTTTAVATTTCAVTRDVWYPDAASIAQKAQVALDAGASGVFIWALGYESADVAGALRPLADAATNPDGTDPMGAASVAVVPGYAEVSGWAFDPETDLPVRVQISVTGGSSFTRVARESRPDIASAHQGVGRFHGFSESIRMNPGPQTICVTASGWGVGATSINLGCTTVDVPVLFTQDAAAR
jgi:hypothetical protein